MPKQRGVSGFWLDIKALENDRTHLIGDHGAKEGMLIYAIWVRLFTWQYKTAAPIRDYQHVARLTGLNVRTAQRLMQSLVQSLPQSLVQRSGQWYCKRTLQVLSNYNKNQYLAGATSDPKKVEDSDSDSDLEEEDSPPTSPQDSVSESKESLSSPARTSLTGDKKIPDCPHRKIIELYHEHCPTLRRVRTWEGERPKHLRARWKDYPHLEWWEGFLSYVAESDFLTGKTSSWAADLEWIIRPNNFQKINEGKYHEQRIPETEQSVSIFSRRLSH